MVDFALLGDYLMVGITAVYVIATWFLVTENRKTNELARLQIDEARKFNEENLRPVVTVNLSESDHVTVLRFRNEGKRTVEGVRVEFEYPLTNRTMFKEAQKRLLESEFNIAPGDTWDLKLYVRTTGDYRHEENEFKKIVVNYHDKSKEYREETIINFSSYNWASHPRGVEDVMDKMINEIRFSGGAL